MLSACVTPFLAVGKGGIEDAPGEEAAADQAARYAMAIRGIWRGFGLKAGPTTLPTFEARVRALVLDHPTLVMATAGSAGGAGGTPATIQGA